LSSQSEKTDLFQRDPNGKIMPTIENFYRFCRERKLMGVKCGKCGAVFVLPRVTCPKCHSVSMDWIELRGTGKLLSYSIVYVSTPEYQSQTPYAVGIVELDEGARLSGVIRNIKHEELKIGLNLVVDFEENPSQEWPQWPRYVFKNL
jgi:uncharacterized OB-fold protein